MPPVTTTIAKIRANKERKEQPGDVLCESGDKAEAGNLPSDKLSKIDARNQ
jgi:hypothetical protein